MFHFRCNEALDDGIDKVTIGLVADSLQLMYEIRDSAGGVKEEDPIGILRQWLQYLSMLMDVSVSGIMLLAVHSQALLSSMLFRLPFEYLVRALYFEDHPEEAVFQSYRVAREQKTFYEETSQTTDPAFLAAQKLYDDAVVAYPGIATNRKPKTIAEMVREYSHDGPGTYASLYRVRSALLHGSAFGLTAVLDDSVSGALSLTFDVPKDFQNALLVDLAGYVLDFASCYERTLSVTRNSRFAALNARLAAARLKHPEGRIPGFDIPS